ncbi:MAG: amidase [Ardenticatenia bacterium]|nr:MAG: amidase [Ardenticatenia bacterium]
MRFPEYDQLDALALADLVHRGEITPLELVDAAIERIEARNPAINAVVHTMFERARETAQKPLPEGPFKGVPFLLKDLMSLYAGEPLTYGSRFLKDWRPTIDSELVKRYRAAGVIVLGKTNTPELGLVPYTEPELFGPTRNPWDTSRTPGGSSGGSGAAVAARMVPMAGGGDGGGSIRIPASCCGLFGLKPTRGRTPLGPLIGESWEGFNIEHVLTRSVRDSAAMLDAIAGPDVGAPYFAPPPERPFLEEVGRDPGRLRIAITTIPFMGHDVHEDCKRAVAETARLLEDLGHIVEEAAPQVDGEALSVAFLTMLTGQVAADIQDLAELSGRTPHREDFEIATWTLGLLGRAVNAEEYVRAVRYMQSTARRVGAFFEQYDILVTPTLAQPPVPIGSLQPTALEKQLMNMASRLRLVGLLKKVGMVEQVAAKTFDFIPYTPLFNITGQPAMSVPLYWNAENLPIGVQFVGRFADEATLFRLASQLEQARPWQHKMPPLVASQTE